MYPKISVIVPVYNSSTYLDVLLSSLIKQSLKEIEIIVVDDKSTDNSLDIIRNYAAQESRVKVIEHEKNRGVSATRNTGIQHAKGLYVAFADSDDYMMPDTLLSWFEFSFDKQLDLMIGNAFRFVDTPFESTHQPMLGKQSWRNIKRGGRWIEDAVEVKEWPHYTWLQLVSLNLIKRTGISFIEGLIHEDIIWTMQIALAASRISFFEKPLYGYRKTPNSIVNTLTNESQLCRCKSYLPIIDTIGKQARTYPQGSTLRRALLRQCNQESGHLLGIVRKKITNDSYKTDIAKGFFDRNLHKVILEGSTNTKELFRALKCTYTLRQYC